MTSRSDTLANANQLVSAVEPLLAFLSRPDSAKLLAATRVEWDTGRIVSLAPRLRAALEASSCLTADESVLKPKALYLLGRMLIDIEALSEGPQPLQGKYRLVTRLAAGNNSVTFKAINEAVNRPCVLKLIRPGAAPDLLSHLQRLGAVGGEPFLVHPSDFLFVPYSTLGGDQVNLQCVVYPFVEGQTLAEYIKTRPPVSPYFFEAFVRQVGLALAALEAAHAYHGDLHSGNILVTRSAGDVDDFRIIDISFGIGTPSIYRERLSDSMLFQAHLWSSLHALQAGLPRISLQKHLGAKLYYLLKKIIEAKQLRFADVLALVEKNQVYDEYLRRREDFIRSRFKEPTPMGLLRYEEITNPAAAVTLFEPYAELFNQLKVFGNALLSGERGSGKSTYLAALAFFPEAESGFINPEASLGVFFACRQGEFKLFSAENITFDSSARRGVKHVLVLKIIRRVVVTLAGGVANGRLQRPASYAELYKFLRPHIGEVALGPYEGVVVTPLDNLSAALQRNENRALHHILQNEDPSEGGTLLDELELRQFFEVVRRTIPRLEKTQFILLFDDAGEPNVPRETQRILNDLVVSVNPVYCVKLSAERYSYELATASGKALEIPHDYFFFDIGRFLAVGGGREPERVALRDYFRQLLAKRLSHWEYRSAEIESYLGILFQPLDDLVVALARSKRNAYYASWEIVWQLADRTPRNLLELVSEIFAAGNVTPQSPPRVIPARVQNTAIRRVSERRLRALTYLPGGIETARGSVPLGRHVFAFATAFGKIGKLYLHRGTGKKRPDELLAIERNDSTPIAHEAEDVLEALMRFGVLDESRYVVARDDRMTKPLYVFNRVFCPAFGISFRRESHLRVSRRKFEELLLRPLEFVGSGTQFLSELANDEAAPLLFEEEG
jgi:hypothetical protein